MRRVFFFFKWIQPHTYLLPPLPQRDDVGTPFVDIAHRGAELLHFPLELCQTGGGLGADVERQRRSVGVAQRGPGLARKLRQQRLRQEKLLLRNRLVTRVNVVEELVECKLYPKL